MKKFLFVSAFLAALCAARGEGPRTSAREFFIRCLDCSIPELRELPAKTASGDIAGAKAVFAAYVRKTVPRRTLDPEWFSNEGFSSREMADLKRAAKLTMDYHVKSCGVPWHFKDRKIDWMFNPTYNGYREWPWQLSRHHFLTRLAEYFVRTGDRKAVETWRDMVLSWIRQAEAPPEGTRAGATICWRTIDTGLRACSWCRQILALAGEDQLSDDFLTDFFISLYEHGRRLAPSLTSNNWRIMELGGLVHIAVLFPFFKDAPAWRAAALDELARQLARQLYPDGFQFELTPGYHGILDSQYGMVLDLFRRSGETPPPFILSGMEKAFEVYPRLMRPDGRDPGINDSGDMGINGKMKRASSLYPDRSDFLWFASGRKKGRAPDYLSYAFPYAGAVVFRTSWEKDAIWAYMDCSPFGHNHQHEDKLNLLVSAYGKNLLVEAGTFAYDDSDMRRYVLSSRAHNTILVDGLGQYTRRDYYWGKDDLTKKADLEFATTDGYDMAKASFTAGYGPIGNPKDKKPNDKTVHTRTTIFMKKVPGTLPFFAVIDRLNAPDARKRTYEILWHLETCALSIEGTSFRGDFGKGVGLSAAVSDVKASIADHKGEKKPNYQGWMPSHPSGPEDHRPAPMPIVSGTFETSRRIVTILYPYKDGADALAGVEASDSCEATSFTVVLKDGRRIEFNEKDFPGERPGDVPPKTVVLSTDKSRCTVAVDGGRVISYEACGEEILWNAEPVQTSAEDWAHGGIPVCWPWFGVNAEGRIHGTAWRRPFNVLGHSSSAAGGTDSLVLGLDDGDLRLRYRITLSDSLDLELETSNAGTNTLTFSAGFHPYFRLGERDMSVVDGIDGLPYREDPSCPVQVSGVWSGTLSVTSAVDRIFRLGPGGGRRECRLFDRSRDRYVSIEMTGANGLNIWNPGAEKNCPGDVPGDSWRHFASIEPLLRGTAAGKRAVLAPGESRVLRMTVRAGRRIEGNVK